MSARRLAEEQPDGFEFAPESRAWIDRLIARYPEHRQASAVVPLLWRAQKQHDGWLPRAAMEKVADMLGMPYIRVLEVATFYTMFNLEPVGKYFIQMCGTTPCMLNGSDDIKAELLRRVGPERRVSADRMFSWIEVECLGACCNAPMVQINDDYYEDLTPENFSKLLDDLAAGRPVRPGPQNGRTTSEPAGRLTSLVSFYGEDGKSGPASAPASATPPDFPGPVSVAQPPVPDGDHSAAPTESAAQTLARKDEESLGRPESGGQRSDPRQENPVHELGQRQHDAATRKTDGT
jgi:NADH-quinone oxidoreductase subunit E